MVSFKIARSSRRFRFNAGLGLVSLLLFGAYVLALTQLQRSTEQTYAKLRTSDPDRYLSEIRQAEGFRVYLEKFGELKGYETPQRLAPPFLIGRWVLHDKPLRVDDSYVPPSCLDNVVIQDGQIRTDRPKHATYDVRYVIGYKRVLAMREGQAPIVIVPIGYGIHVNHIEITLPDDESPRYGYMCK
jgi:hypothetical protein